MHDRQRARQILEQARDLLTHRLSERVLDLREEILEDAGGESFSSEIETLHDQIGSRLQLVNQMLANLPANVDSLEAIPSEEVEPLDSVSFLTFSPVAEGTAQHEPRAAAGSLLAERDADVDFDAGVFDEMTEASVTPSQRTADPATHEESSLPSDTQSANFALFLRQVQKGLLDDAGRTLSALLGLSPHRGRECAASFAEQMRERSDVLSQAMHLRVELANGSVQKVLQLLSECFGLDGLESAVAWNRLRQT